MRVIRKSELAQIIGLSQVHIMRKVGEGTFPAPIRLGPNSIGWVSTDVERWIKQRQAERDRNR